ncbi:NAD(P)-dependent oxidoreductase [Pollutimonas harenae]|nr:NAD(P)-dependent oxidoreductase [Pollutimonas harenae]
MRDNMTQQTIGFVGLGVMGRHVARRMVQDAFRVQAYDINPEPLEHLKEIGGIVCTSAAATAVNASHIVIFVVNGKQAEQVIFGPGGLHETAAAGLTIISCVTMLPSEARFIGERCREHGWSFIDAPVSGGEVGAKQGDLTVMASGDKAALDASHALLTQIGTRLKRVGNQPGQGALVKTINQLLCGVHLAAAGEAIAMAQRAGLEPQAVFDVVSQSAAGSWMLSNRGPRMVASAFDTSASAVDIFVKDLGIVMDVARELKFPASLAATALQSFLGASGAGLGLKDDSAVVQYYNGFQRNKE